VALLTILSCSKNEVTVQKEIKSFNGYAQKGQLPISYPETGSNGENILSLTKTTYKLGNGGNQSLAAKHRNYEKGGLRTEKVLP